MRHYFTSTQSSLARGGSKLLSKSLIPFMNGQSNLPSTLMNHADLSVNSRKQIGSQLNQQNEVLGKEMHRNMFLGKWMGGYGRQEKKEEKVEIDISDIEFEGEELGWGGMTRPGTNSFDKEFSEEEPMGDEWDQTEDDRSDDDDYHGGEMMPIPRLF